MGLARQRALVASSAGGALSLSQPRKSALKELAARIGHDFSNPALLDAGVDPFERAHSARPTKTMSDSSSSATGCLVSPLPNS